MTQTYFPREALIFAGLGSVVFNFFNQISFSNSLIYYEIPFLVEIHYIILGLSALFVLGFSIGLIICPIGFYIQTYRGR